MLEAFYEEVAPTPGVTVVATLKESEQKTWPQHYAVPSHLLQQVVEHLNDSPDESVYISLGAYDIPLGYTLDNKVEYLKRKPCKIKAVAFDLDVGEEEGKYETIRAAADALIEVYSQGALPQPSWVVATGGGLHIYYVLGDVIEYDVWANLFSGLRQAALDAGLLIDRKVGSYPYRLLRAPGSHNKKLKYGERTPPVSVLQRGGKHTLESLQSYCVVVPEKKRLDQDATEFKPIPRHHLLNACPAAKYTVETGGVGQSEPVWFGWANVCQGTVEGRELFHEFSKEHASYDADRTDDKFDASHGNYPSGCETFYSLGKCQNCPAFNRNSNPLAHARFAGQVDPNAQLPNFEQFTPIQPSPDAPEEEGDIGFSRIDDELYCYGNHVSSYFDVDQAQFNDKTQKGVARLTRYDGTTCFFPLKALGHKNNVGAELSNLGIRVTNTEAALMYIQDTALKQPPVREVIHFGWGEDLKKFGTPNGLMPDGRLLASDSLFKMQERWGGQKGSLKNWLDAVDMLKYPGQEPMLMCLLASLGSPLMFFLGLEKGVIYSVQGERGIGKTSAFMVANSVWGQPLDSITVKQDTENTARKKCAMCHSLPFTMDETTIVEPKALQRFAYEISQGTGRGRLTKTGDLGDSEQWHLIAILNSNNSIHQKLLEVPTGDNADLDRVFEVHVTKHEVLKHSKVSMSEGDRMVTRIKNNYGLFAEPYIKLLLKQDMREDAQEAELLKQQLIAKHQLEGCDRFMLSLVIACYGAHKLAKRVDKRFPGDPEEMFNWMQMQLVRNRQTINQLIDERIPDVENFLLHFEQDGNIVGAVLGKENEFVVTGQSFKGYLYQVGEHVYVPKELLDVWCYKRDLPTRMLLDSWAANGFLVPIVRGINPRYSGKAPRTIKINGESIRPNVIVIDREAVCASNEISQPATKTAG